MSPTTQSSAVDTDITRTLTIASSTTDNSVTDLQVQVPRGRHLITIYRPHASAIAVVHERRGGRRRLMASSAALSVLAVILFAMLDRLPDLYIGQPAALTSRPAATPYWLSQSASYALGGGAGPGVQAPGSAGFPVIAQPTPPNGHIQPTATPPTGSASVSDVQPAPRQPWPPTNPWLFIKPAFVPADPDAHCYGTDASGQCTCWTSYTDWVLHGRRPGGRRLVGMGNALYWADSARARGYRMGDVPRLGATVVFQPGVQGAGGAGHVAHVETVYPNGWFEVSEMNFYWNGGGLGIVSFRYAHTGAGVTFIYP